MNATLNTSHTTHRRPTIDVAIGNVVIGSNHRIAVQSMTNTQTHDVEASVAQIKELYHAGADIVRLTAQGIRQATALGEIRAALNAEGVTLPLVADIHFNPAAAFESAKYVEKVRINPGNFVDPGRTFKKLEYTDEEYRREIHKIEEKLVPLLDLCRERGVTLRLGVNHGSLSDRIMSRYGDTPAGMVESVMEFLRVCRAHDFDRIVISIKASNVTVMVDTVHRLVHAMDGEDMHYPLHLGVTEAGDADDGRIKSAVGIGTLLAEGIGDTIRVSLSEDPVNEIPVARMLVDHIEKTVGDTPYEPLKPTENIPSDVVTVSTPQGRVAIGGTNVPVVVGVDIAPDAIPETFVVLASDKRNAPLDIIQQLQQMRSAGDQRPAIVRLSYDASLTAEEVIVAASADMGRIFLTSSPQGLWIEAPSLTREQCASLSLGILQATRKRISKTEYIACPGCGRTLFALSDTLQRIKDATSHLVGLKIGVMGCIVNGPGEMADADFGYVGAAKGMVSLYHGKTCVQKNIPAEEAIEHLVKLIKDNGQWHDPNE